LRTGNRLYRVTLKDILEAHKLAIVDGGLAGIRDRGAIEAAIARPYSGIWFTTRIVRIDG
jgi:hypothetical protein